MELSPTLLLVNWNCQEIPSVFWLVNVAMWLDLYCDLLVLCAHDSMFCIVMWTEILFQTALIPVYVWTRPKHSYYQSCIVSISFQQGNTDTIFMQHLAQSERKFGQTHLSVIICGDSILCVATVFCDHQQIFLQGQNQQGRYPIWWVRACDWWRKNNPKLIFFSQTSCLLDQCRRCLN